MTMTDEYSEALSRLLDGEPVEEAKLREALAQPGALGLLQEWANLRHLLRADLGEPEEEFCNQLRRRLRTPGWRRLLQERLVPVGVAASLLAAASLGYGVRWWLEPAIPAARPGVQLAAVRPPSAPPPPSTSVAPQPPSAGSNRATSLRSEIPAPRTRVPFAQWRDSTLPH
jgi:hypothetical protein